MKSTLWTKSAYNRNLSHSCNKISPVKLYKSHLRSRDSFDESILTHVKIDYTPHSLCFHRM